MTDMKGISRRSFLTGSAVLGGAAALAGLAGCSPAPKDTSMAETGSATEEDWLGEAPVLTEADCDNVVDADGGRLAFRVRCLGERRESRHA